MEKQKACFKTSIGGQALIEGIYMRGPKKESIVVNTPDGLQEKVQDLKLIKDRYPILGWPLIRGFINFFASLISGVKSLMYSASFFPEEEEAQESKIDKWLEKKFGDKAEKYIVALAVVIGVVFSVALFFVLPTLISGIFVNKIESSFLRSLIEGVIRIIIFLAYLFLCSRMSDMKRVFSYHGAEHKTIHCYEAGLPLTVENVRRQTRLHPRCGTSFLFVVIIISILLFAVVRATNPILRVIYRLLLLPVVVAISYEFNRFVGRHDNWFTRALSFPGMSLQYLTTNEPDDDMIKVGIRALELVIPEVEGEDKW